VKVILSIDEGKAYIQNADTNAYLEGKLEVKADLVNGKVPVEQLPAMGYSKEEILTDATKAAFGFSADAVPNHIFTHLGKYNQHWWRRYGYIPAHATETAFTNKSFMVTASASHYFYIDYADSYEVANDGTVSLVNAKRIETTPQGTSYIQDTIRGKYFAARLLNNSSHVVGGICYCDAAATISQGSASSGTYTKGFVVSSGKMITGVAESTDGVEYVQSIERNAYPDTGVSNGSLYEYLGVPFHNAVAVPKIVTGSYDGTHVLGKENPNRLTFDFVPKVVWIVGYTSSDGSWYSIESTHGFVLMDLLTTEFVSNRPPALGSSDLRDVYSRKSEDGKTLEWYYNSSVESYSSKQLNYLNQTYYYMAIG